MYWKIIYLVKKMDISSDEILSGIYTKGQYLRKKLSHSKRNTIKEKKNTK